MQLQSVSPAHIWQRRPNAANTHGERAEGKKSFEITVVVRQSLFPGKISAYKYSIQFAHRAFFNRKFHIAFLKKMFAEKRNH